MTFLKKVIEKIKRCVIISMISVKKFDFKGYLYILAGTFICSFGIAVFYAPSGIVAGGVSGIAIILYKLYSFPMGLFMLLINIPLFILGLKLFGGSFGVKTLVGTVLISFFISIFEGRFSLTDNMFLASLFGGALSGFGLGILFLSGATSGGTDVLAKLGNKYFSFLDIGKWLFLIDFIIIFTGGIVFKNYELMLFGIIAVFVNTYTIDFILAGADFAKVVYIISPKSEEIAGVVINRLKRGVTGIYAKGLYTKNDTLMLMCIVKRLEVTRLKQIAKEIDPNSFIILTQAREVAGEGFKKYPE